MKTSPLQDDADLAAIVKHLNQMHSCEHLTQEKIAAVDGKVDALAESLQARELESVLRNQKLIDMIMSVQMRLGAVPGAPPERVKPIKEPPDWLTSVKFNLSLIGGAIIVAKLVDHFWPLLPGIWKAIVNS